MISVFTNRRAATSWAKRAVQPGRGAFTLIELLVVIAIIAILAAILLPTLSRAKAQGEGIKCMSNQKQLALAFIMYADDNHGLFSLNSGEANQQQDLNGYYQQWCKGIEYWPDKEANDPDNTNSFYLAHSLLGPFCNFQTAIYKCPSDIWNCTEFGASYPRVRSVSMSGFIADGSTDGVSAWDSTGETRSYNKQADFVNPAPANLIVFDDEHPDSINDACLVNRGLSSFPMFDDLPGSLHVGACNFSYADGHSQLHKWLSTKTMRPVTQTTYQDSTTEGDVTDVSWFLYHATAPTGSYRGPWPPQ
jgi:prepilin-type N-terminal cleavage/methylation domain-containing protein/prepilin-type processing-associated H-X9-DG protein